MNSSDHVQPVLKENQNMLDSFSVMNTELSTLAINLKTAQEDRFKQAEVGYTPFVVFHLIL